MENPFLLMVAGPNGSGKTTLTKWLREAGVEFGDYINPDDIAGERDGPYAARVAAAQVIADRRREACIGSKRSFSFETVMSHPSKIEVLVRAKAAGFFVQLFFVGIDDPDTNIERVALRVAQGGHDVPTDRIVARWYRTMGLLHEAISACDRALVFDNSATGYSSSVHPRLVFQSSSKTEDGSRKLLSQVFPPLPVWVSEYVLRPLGLHSSTV